MTLPIISADQRLAENRGIKGVIFGKSGIGKTSLLWTLPAPTTLFFDLEAGDLAIEGWTVVGAGSSGCVLAARLSEDPARVETCRDALLHALWELPELSPNKLRG